MYKRGEQGARRVRAGYPDRTERTEYATETLTRQVGVEQGSQRLCSPPVARCSALIRRPPPKLAAELTYTARTTEEGWAYHSP